MIYNPEEILNTTNHQARSWLETEYSLHSSAENGQINTVYGGCWLAVIKKDKNKIDVAATLFEDFRHQKSLKVYRLKSQIPEGSVDWYPIVHDVFQLLTMMERQWYQNFLDTLVSQGVKYAIN